MLSEVTSDHSKNIMENVTYSLNSYYIYDQKDKLYSQNTGPMIQEDNFTTKLQSD